MPPITPDLLLHAFPTPLRHALLIPVFIQSLDNLRLKMQTFLQSQKALTTQRDRKLTRTDHEDIPRYLADAVQFLHMMEVTRDAITVNYHRMSDREILMIDDRMVAIEVLETRMQIIIAWFRDQIAFFAFLSSLEH